MWRQIRDPEFLLGALKTYRMMTGLSPDGHRTSPRTGGRTSCRDYAPSRRPSRPRPPPSTSSPRSTAWRCDDELRPARRRAGRRGAAERLLDPARRARLQRAALRSGGDRAARLDPGQLRRAERRRRSSPAARTRRCASASTGIFTYAGFHDVVLDRLEDVAAQAALDRSVFAGGCPESADDLGRRARRRTC